MYIKKRNTLNQLILKTMKIITFLLSLLLIGNFIYGQTTIEDGEEVSGVWTVANSPYTVMGEAIILQDETLTIEAGVEVKFKIGDIFNYQNANFDAGILRVNGKLVAQGTELDPIVFTRDGSEGNWGIIYFSETSDATTIIEYCEIEYGKWVENLIVEQAYFYGAVSFYEAGAIINNNIFTNNSGAGIACYSNSNCTITNNELSYNSYGVSCEYSIPNITDNTASNNTSYGFSFEHCTVGTVCNNIITENNAAGIECNGSEVTISYNLIDNNGVGGIYILFGDNSNIINNTISNNGRGIYVNENSTPKIIGNAIVNNINAMYCSTNADVTITNTTISYSSDVGVLCDAATLTITNSILWSNGALAVNSNSSADISYSLIEGGTQGNIQFIEGNIINEDPLFVNPASGDFHLSDNSPCVNVGNNDVEDLPENDLDGNQRIQGGIIDMGCYETSVISSIVQTTINEGFTIFPNPTNRIINFEFADNNIEKLIISDITGKTIIKKIDIQQNEMIDLSSFVKGIYFISVQTEEEVYTKKIIKR
ncbi:MAG: hypothetical protein B6D64_13580 [Bacteroidetes bacterium 4484_276]|nr:MAG: hypothetical protein B6D64_13580 [Bacteroidetes bacterium 4484_276]